MAPPGRCWTKDWRRSNDAQRPGFLRESLGRSSSIRVQVECLHTPMGADLVSLGGAAFRNLVGGAKELLESGVTGIATMSGLMKDALQTYLKMMRKQQIDLAFLQAAADSQYQRLSREVNAMFAISDRETMFGEKKQGVENRETTAASTRHA